MGPFCLNAAIIDHEEPYFWAKLDTCIETSLLKSANPMTNATIMQASLSAVLKAWYFTTSVYLQKEKLLVFFFKETFSFLKKKTGLQAVQTLKCWSGKMFLIA